MIVLKNEYLTVEISDKGAEVKSIKTADGTEYMWQGGGEFWEGTAPNLFPIVGRLRDKKYTVDGKVYNMDIHGFACFSKFSVVEESQNMVKFNLKDNEDTLKVYPYHFSFSVTHELIENRLKTTYTVENIGDKTMYYSVGAHPGFNVPLAKGGYFDQYYLEFAGEKTPTAYEVTADGFITGKKEGFSLIFDKTLPLAGQEIFVPTVFFEDMVKKVVLKSNKTRRSVIVEYDDFEYLALWHDDNAPFICIEPWTGTPDKIGDSTEISEKNAITAILAGDTDEYSYTVTIK